MRRDELPDDGDESTPEGTLESAPEGTLRLRTVWISDLHLGTSGCQAKALLHFLRHVECETLFLVGDIIDGWQLRRQWYWPQSHNDVVQKLLRKARKGTRVIFIPELKVKRAVSDVGGFETAVAREARSRGVHGVVCGHIHHAEMRQIDGILYCNDGDWVESLTALVEHADGRLEILDWSEHELRPNRITAGLPEPVPGSFRTRRGSDLTRKV